MYVDTVCCPRHSGVPWRAIEEANGIKMREARERVEKCIEAGQSNRVVRVRFQP